MFFAVIHAGGFNPAGPLGVAITQTLMLSDRARVPEAPFSRLKNARPVPSCRGSRVQPTSGRSLELRAS